MNEDFLHFVWQYSYFSSTTLVTTTGQPIVIEKCGFFNTDAGPDFQEAIVHIGDVKWAGTIEIHVHSSDWLKHKHQHDKAYDNVILHVVWEHDKELALSCPTLELKQVVSHDLVQRYEYLKQNLSPIPCSTQLPQVSNLAKINMLEKALVDRFYRKSDEVLQLYRITQDWQETSYRLLLKYMGYRVNNDAFLQLAEALPLKVLLKHRDQLLQLEALLYGQSGLILAVDMYSTTLMKEYQFLVAKYQLADKVEMSRWKFLRLRPANFPTIRIAQLANIIHKHASFFSHFVELNTVEELKSQLTISVSDYWKKHYHFGKEKAKKSSGTLGESSVEGIAINVVAPLKFAYAMHVGNDELKEKAIDFLTTISKENNVKTRKMEEVGFQLSSAADTQGAIELLDGYCSTKRCLRCSIGTAILKSNR